MTFKSVSTKMPQDEIARLDIFCLKKGISKSAFIREIINREIEHSLPKMKAGTNLIKYDTNNNKFTWKVILDTGEEKVLLRDLSSEFIEQLIEALEDGVKDRNLHIQKINDGSVAIPRKLIEEGEE